MSDGPTCETCGKETCPDADLPAFSAPVECIYRPVYEALRASKDCDYGCARDYTNQQISLWIAEAIEGLLTKTKADALREAAEALTFDEEDITNATEAMQEGEWQWFVWLMREKVRARADRLEADS